MMYINTCTLKSFKALPHDEKLKLGGQEHDHFFILAT